MLNSDEHLLSTNKAICEVLLELKANEHYETECYSETNVNTISLKETLLRRIELIIVNAVAQISEMRVPLIEIPEASAWHHCTFNGSVGLKESTQKKKLFFKGRSEEDFAITFHLLAKIYRLLRTNQVCTRREIFYQDVDLMKKQFRVDKAVSRISCCLNIPQWDLNLLTTSKGLIQGDLIIQLATGDVVNCRLFNRGVLIPQILNNFKLTTEANFVLLVEKDAIFQKLLDEGFTERFKPCILITGKGVPDVNTRYLLNALSRQTRVPIFGLFDADPYGIEIMSTYKFGSRAMSHMNSSLAIPSMKWLGVHSSDFKSSSQGIPLKDIDLSRFKSLLGRPYINTNPSLLKEVEDMKASGKKYEIESVANLSTTHLTDVYIPLKISTKKYL